MTTDTESAPFEGFERLPSFTRRQWDLLDAALRLLDRVGIAEFTMRALADEVGLSPMAAYKHFDNQRTLQLELWRECQSHFSEALRAAARQQEDPASAFVALCRAFAEYAVAYPYRYEFLYNHPFVREIVAEPSLEDRRQEIWVYARDLISAAQRARLFRDDRQAEDLLLAALSQIRGLAGNIIYARMIALGERDTASMIDSGIAFILDALIAR